MNCEKTGALIRQLRKEQKLTQKQLAKRLNLSAKTVSKWECGGGCPDVTLLQELSVLLKVDIRELLTGELTERAAEGGNMKQTRFFVCPTCGSISFVTGQAAVSCCGRPLEALEAKKALPEEKLRCTQVEDEWFIETDHEATKENYISFIAFLTGDSMQVLRQYPEWEVQARIPRRRHGTLVWYSTTKGLFYQLI